MLWYFVAIALHILAAVVWIGRVVYRVAFLGPVVRQLEAAETSRLLDRRQTSVDHVGLGCLVVVILSGVFVLYYQGVTITDIVSGRLFSSPFGHTLGAKLVLTVALVVLQLFASRGRAVVDWLMALVGLTVIGLSVVLIR